MKGIFWIMGRYLRRKKTLTFNSIWKKEASFSFFSTTSINSLEEKKVGEENETWIYLKYNKRTSLTPFFCCFPFTKSKIEKERKRIGSEKRMHAESVPLN